MIYSKPELLAMAVDLSKGVDPALTCAVIHSLSQWMPTALSSSPDYAFPGDSADSQEGLCSTYGLMQFSGSQARSSGWQRPFYELLEPEDNLKIGIGILGEALGMVSRPETALLLYLGRSRAGSIPEILGLVQHYEGLIAARPA